MSKHETPPSTPVASPEAEEKQCVNCGKARNGFYPISLRCFSCEVQAASQATYDHEMLGDG